MGGFIRCAQLTLGPKIKSKGTLTPNYHTRKLSFAEPSWQNYLFTVTSYGCLGGMSLQDIAKDCLWVSTPGTSSPRGLQWVYTCGPSPVAVPPPWSSSHHHPWAILKSRKSRITLCALAHLPSSKARVTCSYGCLHLDPAQLLHSPTIWVKGKVKAHKIMGVCIWTQHSRFC